MICLAESKFRRPSKHDRATELLTKVQAEISAGKSIDEALEVLTLAQYDFLCDYLGDELDKVILSPEQQSNIREMMKKGVGRPLFPNGYEKKYPKFKRDFHAKLVALIVAEGGEIIPREKENYRDIDFIMDGIHQRIVYSVPTKK